MFHATRPVRRRLQGKFQTFSTAIGHNGTCGVQCHHCIAGFEYWLLDMKACMHLIPRLCRHIEVRRSETFVFFRFWRLLCIGNLDIIFSVESNTKQPGIQFWQIAIAVMRAVEYRRSLSHVARDVAGLKCRSQVKCHVSRVSSLTDTDMHPPPDIQQPATSQPAS